LDGPNMFALLLPNLAVGAGTTSGIGIDLVPAPLGLGRYDPQVAVGPEPVPFRDPQALLLAGIDDSATICSGHGAYTSVVWRPRCFQHRAARCPGKDSNLRVGGFRNHLASTAPGHCSSDGAGLACRRAAPSACFLRLRCAPPSLYPLKDFLAL